MNERIDAAAKETVGSTRPGLRVLRGSCRVYFAWDVAQAIDLAEAGKRLASSTQEESIRRTRPGPKHFEFVPPPLRAPWPVEPIEVCGRRASPTVEATLWDFGAVCVSFTFPIEGSLDGVAPFSEALYENRALQSAARLCVEAILAAIGPAASRPHIAEAVEDYAVFVIEAHDRAETGGEIAAAVAAESASIARLLRAERGAISAQQTQDAMSCIASYGRDDVLVVDWNAAVLFDAQPGDTLAVLEYTNIELLELRVLDARLDAALDEAHRTSTRGLRGGLFGRVQSEELRRVARLQVEGALLFEGVNNAIKLVGDQHLARVYRLASQRLHLQEWDANVLRKLSALESVYQKLNDERSNRRMEILEWIIIVLIAISMVMPLLGSL